MVNQSQENCGSLRRMCCDRLDEISESAKSSVSRAWFRWAVGMIVLLTMAVAASLFTLTRINATYSSDNAVSIMQTRERIDAMQSNMKAEREESREFRKEQRAFNDRLWQRVNDR